MFARYVNPTSHGVSDSVAPMGGGLRGPPPQYFCDCSGTVKARTLKFIDFS